MLNLFLHAATDTKSGFWQTVGGAALDGLKDGLWSIPVLFLAYLLMEAHRCGFSLCVGIPLTDSGVLIVGEANEPKIFTVGRI